MAKRKAAPKKPRKKVASKAKPKRKLRQTKKHKAWRKEKAGRRVKKTAMGDKPIAMMRREMQMEKDRAGGGSSAVVAGLQKQIKTAYSNLRKK